MADVLYPPYKEAILTAGLNLTSADIRVALMKSTYTYDAAHDFMDDVVANENGRSAALGSKTVALGVFDAADTTVTATASAACNAVIIFYHTGSDATARLIAYIDFTAFTPAASQVCTVSFNASGIFAL
jgi:hypothetical protein